MPVKKYLEIDSTYRNRNLYPNPGSFIVNIAQGSGKTQLNATDPVSNAYTDIKFFPSNYNNLTFKLVVASGANPPYPEIASSSKTTLVFILTKANTFPIELFKLPNSFSGLVLSSKQTNNYILRRILESTFLNTRDAGGGNFDNYFLMEIDNPIPDDMLQATTTFTVYDPSTITTPDTSYFFIPTSVGIDNFYQNYVVYNRIRLNYATIISFDGTTHVAGLSNISDLGWTLSDIYEVKRAPPQFVGNLTVGLSNIANSVNLGVETSPNFINSFLEIIAGSVDILVYKIIAIVGTYKDKYGSTVYTTNLQEMSAFTNYVVVDKYDIENVLGLQYQFLQYSYDNTNGFKYTGSMVSVTQPSAYELTLNSICLPNIPLVGGGNVWQYPFVYVEIENVSSSSSNSSNIIYSNNPNSNKAVFKVPIVNITNPETYPFLTYNGNGVAQTITIKPNSDMKFTVRLPNGNIFTPFDPTNSNPPVYDTSYGQAPDTQKQLSVLISFEKV